MLSDRSLQIAYAMWSPIRVYLTLDIAMAPGVPEEVCHETLWRWTLEGKFSNADSEEDYPMVDAGSGYTSNTVFVPDLGVFRHRILNPQKPVTMTIRMAFASPDTMPERLLLSAGEEALIIHTSPPD